MMDSVKRIVDEAARLDVKAAIEPVYWHPLENLEAILDVMNQIQDEKHLRMIFDLICWNFQILQISIHIGVNGLMRLENILKQCTSKISD